MTSKPMFVYKIIGLSGWTGATSKPMFVYKIIGTVHLDGQVKH